MNQDFKFIKLSFAQGKVVQNEIHISDLVQGPVNSFDN